ncbi:MAG: hypothetical protein IJF48_01770 [Clostridia bacterium]|nr:hypothetical protein [Clostridia bacterium]
MKPIKITAACMIVVLAFTATSCSWWFDTPFEFVRETDFYDSVVKSPQEDMISALGEDLQFYNMEHEDCTVAYNEKNAWMVDFRINKTTPLVDIEAILADADPTGRGTEYFQDVSVTYEFIENMDKELRIVFTVTSNTADAQIKVYGYYTLFEEGEFNLSYKRGDFRGYYVESTVYPGSDEPIGIYDISDYARLGISDDMYSESYIIRIAKAIVENDVEALEGIWYLKDGILSDWEGMVISEYELIRENPTARYLDRLILKITISESNVERYPAGNYVVTISDGIGVNVDIVRADEVDTVDQMTEAEEWLYTFVAHYGGAHDVNTNGISHSLIDYYFHTLRLSEREPKYEDFVRFMDVCFDYQVKDGDVTRAEIEQHGGHGLATSLCEVETITSSNGIHKIKATYFADPMRSVIGRIDEYTLVETGHEIYKYRFESAECTYDSGYMLYGWSV